MSRSDLPNGTELLVRVLADPAWVRGEAASLDTVRELLSQSLESAASDLVTMEVVFSTVTEANITDTVDTGTESASVVVTMTGCGLAHSLTSQLPASVLHVAVTDLGCSRLEDVGILIPMVPPGSGILQLIADFKWRQSTM